MRKWLEARLDGICDAALVALLALGVESLPWEGTAAFLVFALASRWAVKKNGAVLSRVRGCTSFRRYVLSSPG